MDDQQQPSKWDELARELGAEAPPEPVIVPKPTASAESGGDEPRRKSVAPPPRPKPSPQSWDNLAADLGLEVPPPPPPVPSAPAAPSHAPADVPPPREAESKRDDRSTRSRPPRSEESADAEDRPARTPRQQRDEAPRREQRPRRGREESSRRGREDSPRRSRERSPRRDREELPQQQAPELAPPPSTEPEAKVEAEQPPSLGVSLWHKIFGSPDEQAKRIAEGTGPLGTASPADDWSVREEQPRDDRRARQDEESPTDRAAEAVAEVSESWREESVEVEFVETADTEDRAARPTDENGEPRPRRRRRGRGRGRGRRPEGEQGGEERSADQSEAETDRPDTPSELRESRAPRQPRTRGGRSSRSRRDAPRKQEVLKDDLDDGLEEIVLDDDGDTDNVDLGMDGEDAGSATTVRTPAGHKSIPSWDEAIGIIVDTNLATRTDRRRSSSPQSRGSGSARGRSRGGRRRKKS